MTQARDEHEKHDHSQQDNQTSSTAIMTRNMDSSDSEETRSFIERLKQNLRFILSTYWSFLRFILPLAGLLAGACVVTILLMGPIFYGIWEIHGLAPWEIASLGAEQRIATVYWIAEAVWIFVILPLAGSVILALSGDTNE